MSRRSLARGRFTVLALMLPLSGIMFVGAADAQTIPGTGQGDGICGRDGLYPGAAEDCPVSDAYRDKAIDDAAAAVQGTAFGTLGAAGLTLMNLQDTAEATAFGALGYAGSAVSEAQSTALGAAVYAVGEAQSQAAGAGETAAGGADAAQAVALDTVADGTAAADEAQSQVAAAGEIVDDGAADAEATALDVVADGAAEAGEAASQPAVVDTQMALEEDAQAIQCQRDGTAAEGDLVCTPNGRDGDHVVVTSKTPSATGVVPEDATTSTGGPQVRALSGLTAPSDLSDAQRDALIDDGVFAAGVVTGIDQPRPQGLVSLFLDPYDASETAAVVDFPLLGTSALGPDGAFGFKVVMTPLIKEQLALGGGYLNLVLTVTTETYSLTLPIVRGAGAFDSKLVWVDHDNDPAGSLMLSLLPENPLVVANAGCDDVGGQIPCTPEPRSSSVYGDAYCRQYREVGGTAIGGPYPDRRLPMAEIHATDGWSAEFEYARNKDRSLDTSVELAIEKSGGLKASGGFRHYSTKSQSSGIFAQASDFAGTILAEWTFTKYRLAGRCAATIVRPSAFEGGAVNRPGGVNTARDGAGCRNQTRNRDRYSANNGTFRRNDKGNARRYGFNLTVAGQTAALEAKSGWSQSVSLRLRSGANRFRTYYLCGDGAQPAESAVVYTG